LTEPVNVSRQELLWRCSIPVQKLKVSTARLLFKIKLNNRGIKDSLNSWGYEIKLLWQLSCWVKGLILHCVIWPPFRISVWKVASDKMYGLEWQYFMLLSFLKSINCSTDRGSHYLKWFTMCRFLQLQEYAIILICVSWQLYVLDAINPTCFMGIIHFPGCNGKTSQNLKHSL